MKQYQFIFILLFFYILNISAQKPKKRILNIKKIGFLYNNINDKNFLFKNKDFSYSSSTYKPQAYYNLGTWKSFCFELIVQPQYQILKHQLFNEQFVLPSEENFEKKRIEFTTPKTMHLYAFELGFVIKKEILKNLEFQATMGLGLAIIDTRTERLAKGFTFIENRSFGLSYKTTKKDIFILG